MADMAAITQLFAIKPIDAKDEANPFEAELDQGPLQTRSNQSRIESTKFNNPRNFSRPMGTMLIIFGIIVLLHGKFGFVLLNFPLSYTNRHVEIYTNTDRSIRW